MGSLVLRKARSHQYAWQSKNVQAGLINIYRVAEVHLVIWLHLVQHEANHRVDVWLLPRAV